MKHFFQLLYPIAIFLYQIGVSVAAIIGNSKAKLRQKGSKEVWKELTALKHDKPILWLHASSLGEFEQGRPLIEALKERYPQHYCLVTFFSPSGYEVRKNYAQADLVCYLPYDTKANAARFLATVQPSIAIFVKYELWYFYIKGLQENKIPLILISANFRADQWLFKSYASAMQDLLRGVTHIFVQNETSAKVLQKAAITEVTVAGDTRFDRSKKVAMEAKEFPIIAAFVGNKACVVCGSTWEADEAILSATILAEAVDYQWIIAPHEINEAHLQAIERQLKTSYIRYSQATITTVATNRVLLIDNIGMLASLYRYAKFAYIGGGLGTAGLHNIIEPAVFHLPIFFGDKVLINKQLAKKFPEAVALKTAGGAYPISEANELIHGLKCLENEGEYSKNAAIVKEFVATNIGATATILALPIWQKKLS